MQSWRLTVGSWVVGSEELYAARITVKRSACTEICSDVCFLSHSFFCGMLAVGHLLKVTCQLIAGDDMVLECVEYLDRLRLGVGPGDTSGVFGQ